MGSGGRLSVLHLSLLHASHAYINETPTVIQKKNWIFFVDGVGRFLERSIYY